MAQFDRITGLIASDPTSEARINSASSDLAIKAPCIVATTANISLFGLQTIGSTVLASDDRVLVKNQTVQSENGIYNVRDGSWLRAVDFDSVRDVTEGTLIPLVNGVIWKVSSASNVIGADEITFVVATFLNDETGASLVGITDVGTKFTSDNVEGALQEAMTTAEFDAKTAADIPITDAGNKFTDTDVEGALQEVATTSEIAAGDGSSLIGFLQAGAGAVARTAQSVLRESVSVKDFGAAGDGVADDSMALIGGMAYTNGKLLRFPSGEYMIPFTSTVAVTPPANTVWEGDGIDVSIITFVPSSDTFRKLIDFVNGGLTLRNLTIKLECPAGGVVSFFGWGSDGLVFDRCKLDGGMTNSGATLSHTAHLISCPEEGTYSDISMETCDVTGFYYGTLKTNTATSAQSRATFSHCDFYGNYGEDISINSPLGSFDDIQVYACRFRDGKGESASLSQLHCAFASATNFRVGMCSFSGAVADAIHIEEGCIGGTVTGNTIYVDGNGVVALDNNISGTSKVPQDITIIGNSIRKAGTSKEVGSVGISLVYDASAEVPAKVINTTGNTISGFETGILSGATLDDGCGISRNIINDCTYGLYLVLGCLSVSDNTTRNCTTGIYSSNGAAVNNHTFINCTTNVDATLRPITLIDPIFLFPEFDVTAGSTTYKPILPILAAARASGFANAIVWCALAAADRTSRRDEITWDGTTFTRTNKVAEVSGGVGVDSVSNSGNLAIQVYSASARNAMTVQVKFSGIFVVAV